MSQFRFLIFSLLFARGSFAQLTESFAFGASDCVLDISHSPGLKNGKSGYFTPILSLGLEYHFKGPYSLSLPVYYSYNNFNQLFNIPDPNSSFGPVGLTYRYIFEVHSISIPLMFNYYTNADDEKSWIFSVGAGISNMISLKATGQNFVYFGPFTSYQDTVYNVKELSPGNMNTVLRTSITKKFKTKRKIKPFLRISYSTYTSFWQFPPLNSNTPFYYMRPNYIGVEWGFTIKNQPVMKPKPADETILQGQ